MVTAEIPPVVVKDTIEFNASSFKTLPTALVEGMSEGYSAYYILISTM